MTASTLLITVALFAFLSATFSSPVLTRGTQRGAHPDFYFDGGYFSGSGYWQGHNHDSRSSPDTVPQRGPEPFDPNEPEEGPDTVPQRGPDTADPNEPDTVPQRGPEPFDPNEPEEGPDTVPQRGPEPFDPNEPEEGPDTVPQRGPEPFDPNEEEGPFAPTPPTKPFPSEDDCIGRRRPCFGGGTRSRVNCRDGYAGPCIGRGAYPERPPLDYYYDRQLSTFVLQLDYDYDSEGRVKKHAGRRRRNFMRGNRHIHH